MEIVSSPPKTASEKDHGEKEEENPEDVIVAGSAEKKAAAAAEAGAAQESGKGPILAEDLEEEDLEDLAMEDEEDEEGNVDIDVGGPSEDTPKETTTTDREGVSSTAIQAEDVVILDEIDEDLGLESDGLEEDEEEHAGDTGTVELTGAAIVSETFDASKPKTEEAVVGPASAEEQGATKPAIERPSEQGVVVTEEETRVVEQPATMEAEQPAISVPTAGPPSSSGIVSEPETGVSQTENTPKSEAGTGGRRVRKRSPILWNPQEAGSTAQTSPPQQQPAAGVTPPAAGTLSCEIHAGMNVSILVLTRQTGPFCPAHVFFLSSGRGGRVGGRATRGGRTGRGRGASGQEQNPTSGL